MEITEVVWFGGTSPLIGVVLGKDKRTGEHKAYIGACPGQNEQGDIKNIAAYGSPLKTQQLEQILTHLKSKS